MTPASEREGPSNPGVDVGRRFRHGVDELQPNDAARRRRQQELAGFRGGVDHHQDVMIGSGAGVGLRHRRQNTVEGPV
ncbi:MAG: hypothetical protein GXY83_14695 [Rhodopirellula sp.]|nr:hypothetical protein [Rhodopirellula sp.]